MAQKKRTKKVNKVSKNYILIAVLVLLLAISIGLMVGLTRQADIISKYELLEKIDNQACRYLYQQPAVNGSFDLDVNAQENEPKLVYICTNGQVTTARSIQGKTIASYPLGASVAYFSTNEEAIKYAEEKLNPLRYWGVDAEGQENGIPQTSKFTFIVSDEPVPYFDAYTVKATAVLRVSLPCPDESKEGVTDCYDEANSVLENELKGINVL